ncbi:hypothetical protein H6P81_018326 [Aristolochia fimbriata]|uniref:Cupin type-1 domain-containing protein n=1 Tax=Aristolochia fimbriata TaxID=158543 RepID=A0AAV7E3U0_ARIFI|nr:hypothetical protein H6P81_018326 [Aristolochia fimbriata]
MEVDLSPKFPKKFMESEGGSYHVWLSSDLPMLSEAKVGAGKLVLEPRGLALPHYADCSKLAFVVQGSGITGLISPSCVKERVVRLKEGDTIPVASGVTNWWYNDCQDSTFIVVFLGEARNAHRPGLFSYVFLAGANSVLGGFSQATLGRAWNLGAEQVKQLVNSQPGGIIVKVEEGKVMPGAREEDEDGFVFKLETRRKSPLVGEIGKKFIFSGFSEATQYGRVGNLGEEQVKKLMIPQESRNIVKVEDGKGTPIAREEDEDGFHYKLNNTVSLGRKDLFPLLIGEIGLSAHYAKVNPASPGVFSGSGDQATYVVKGRGRVEIVDMDGRRVLDAEVAAGQAFVVPRFFPFAVVAEDDQGMDLFAVTTSPEPMLEMKTVLENMSPQVLEAAFNAPALLLQGTDPVN